ncbi:MAG: hypothetical protein CMG62_06280 [Candidatus Marinimicrobia bacterium]|nr:hypothetical protein [Candidatus Neomarinimicrobiota bacterium]
MIKRFFDFLFSLLMLIIFSPILILVSLIIYFDIGSPILFKQERPGKNEKIFKLYKFRTMKNIVDSNGILKDDISRISSIGKFLRESSLDELPSLVNVLKGEMSLVGPRPLLIEYLQYYNKEQQLRHNVKPGITGWAQVNGRNSISWEEKFKLDVWYVRNNSLVLDLRILLMTLKKVFAREGINSDVDTTMEKFTGNNKNNL